MNDLQIITVAALILFAAAMAGIGLFSARRVNNMEGFLLGGRKMGAWVSAFAYGTSYFSAVIFVGYAGKHGWDIGLGSIWIGVGNAVVGCLIAWLLLAKRTRSMTRRLQSKTLPEFLQARYDSKNLKIVAALLIFIFLVPYSAAVYKGLGSMFNTIFPDVSVNLCMAIIAVLTAVYLVLGGYLATAYTDFIQGIIMLGGIVCMIIAVVNSPSVGGFGGFLSNLAAVPNNGDGIDGNQLTSLFGGSSFSFLCVNILLTSLGTWGLPQMITKFYTIKDTKSVKHATVISTLFCAVIGCGAYFVGSLSRLVLNNTLPEGGHDAVIPQMLLAALGNGKLTMIILAVILILLLSASMSTLASIVLSSSSAISVDLLPEFTKKLEGKKQISVTRLLCLLFVALSFVFATANISVIVNIMSFSWGVVAGCFIGPYIWGLFSKKITRAAVWTAMIASMATVAVPTVIMTATSGFSSAVAKAPEMGVFAMIVSLITVPVVSLFTKKYPNEHINKVFEFEKEEN